MTDLTLFSTIASASASFVAIIGGLIASKLITINGEREAVNSQIRDLDELIAMKTEEEEAIQQKLDEDDALEYITDHITAIEAKTPLSDVYETDEQQQLKINVLNEYWEIALSLYEEFQKIVSEDGKTNSDDIPVELATQWGEDDFMYSLCKMFAQINDRSLRAIHRGLEAKQANIDWYNRKSKEHAVLVRELDILKLQREQLERKKLLLVHPANMGWGLGIFSGIILFCILLPLLFMKLIPMFPQISDCAATICIILAAIGLIATIVYMYCLLQWKPDKTEVQK